MNNLFYSILEYIIILSVASVFIAVIIDFIKYNEKDSIKASKKSVVATGTMVGFYVIYYLFLRFNIGTIPLFNHTLIIIGTIMIVSGAIINILGRLHLKDNWANHIKIYKDHTLITTGIYNIVRHPLYASIMLMLFGGSLAYRNWISALLTALIFIPAMYYRAKQEEELLEKEFSEYINYKQKVGMFFPKLWR